MNAEMNPGARIMIMLACAANNWGLQEAYDVDSSEPSSQSLAQSQTNDLSIQEMEPLWQVNQPVGQSYKKRRINAEYITPLTLLFKQWSS
jgi:hypothetical protein